MTASSKPGAIFYDHAMKVCSGLDFVALAPISLDARGTFDDPSSAGVEDEHAVVEPLLRNAAELGHPEAQFCLGALYASGVFVDYDDLEALRWYNRAADQGHPQAAFQIVKYLHFDPAEARKTHAPPLPDAEVERLLGIALETRGEIETHFDTEAHFQLGSFLYHSASRFERLDLWSNSGFGRLRTAARQGHVPAMVQVASILSDADEDDEAAGWWDALGQIHYLKGNIEEAERWCMKAQQARRLGNLSDDDQEEPTALTIGAPFKDVKWASVLLPFGGADAAYRLALLSVENEESEVESTEGWFRMAAELGHQEAKWRLAEILWDYWIYDDEHDAASEALKWYRAAEESGHPQARTARLEALFALGSYYEGDAEPLNLDQAKRWFAMAAEEGLADAQFRSGHLASGPEYDPAVSLLWYIKAAEQGHQLAQSRLGYRYCKGIGVPQDHEQAARWYRAAAEQGVSFAQYSLGVLYDDGTGVPQDHEQAARWYRAAAEQGASLAQANLGFLYANGTGAPQDHEQAARWYRAAAEQGVCVAQHDLGCLYADGTGVPQDHEEAVGWYRAAAEQGYSPAQFSLGLVYANGTGVPRDYAEAARWYRAAAEQGYSPAQFNLGGFYAKGTGVPQDYEQAVGWFRAAADQDDEDAQYNLGVLYAKGTGVPQDSEQAARWYRAAAEQGQTAAQYNLGVLYAKGAGVPQDHEEAARWYRAAAEQGHSSAQYNLGVLYAKGTGVTQDHEEAARWYRAAAEQGEKSAQTNLGWLYANGTGVTQDHEEAARWYRAAAEQGEMNAQCNLGWLCANGTGVTQDHEEAAQWYRAAAEQGEKSAQNNLGVLYANGTGVTQDHKEAARWYRAAAEQGEMNAQNNLGNRYANGTGVTKDHEEAARWYRAAAEQGERNAQNSLGHLYTNGTGVPMDLSLALACFQKAAEQGDAHAARNLGLAHLYGRGTDINKDEALKWLRKAAQSGHEGARAQVQELTRTSSTPHPVTHSTTVAEGGGNTPVIGTRNIHRYVVLDFETTGLSPSKGDRVIEVGAVEIIDGRIGRHYESLANPGFPISARITEITTITNAMLRTAPSVERVMRDLAAFIDGATLVAHNAAFDRKFLQTELERLDLWKKPEFLCTLQLGRGAYPGLANHKLKNLAVHLGVALPDTFHRALADAMTTAHIFLRISTPSGPSVVDLFPAHGPQPEPRQTPAPPPPSRQPPAPPPEPLAAPIRQDVPAPAAAAVVRQQTPSLWGRIVGVFR